MANKYKGNTYVWFNLINEPTWGQTEANYLRVHKTLRDAIRATGAENIIVIDGGVSWGRRAGTRPTRMCPA